MTDNKEDMYASISADKIDDLMAIYNDYLYMARVHEQSILLTSDAELATKQIEDTYPDGFEYPWYIKPTNKYERRDFAEFAANDSEGNGKSAYISLQHIKTEENSGKYPVFTPYSYRSMTLGLQLPSAIERFKMAFPKNAVLGNTEFIIDGRYKAVYTGKRNRDKPIEECIDNPDLQDEIIVMLNMSERFRQNEFVTDKNFEKKAMAVYAEEKIAINENNLLEIIGSFSEKVKSICHEKYKGNSGKDDVIRAMNEGFLNLPENFLEYDDIRNLIRHQWVSLEEWEDFMPDNRENAEIKHAARVKSYLKYCDKSIYQRMKTYIAILHQMQQVIAEVKPERLIRGKSESRSKFKKRLKEAMNKYPDDVIEVELNYMPMSGEFQTLKKDVLKILPIVKIVDNLMENEDTFNRMYNHMEDYKKRSDFLQSYHGIECLAVGNCIRHGKNSNKKGKNLNARDAWNYMHKIGVIDSTDLEKWHEYTRIRNETAHSYFNENVRDMLCDVAEQFQRDVHVMMEKLLEKSPEVRKLRDNVYEYTNFDGKVVELDHKNHLILNISEAPVMQSEAEEKSETFDKIKIKTTDGGEIKSVELRNSICVDVIGKNIRWGDNVRWHTSAENSNYLHAGRSVLRTDKELYLKEYHIGKFEPSFRGGDKLLIDNRHCLLLDSAKRIKEFKFKDENNNFIKTQFEHKPNGADRISFDDGTSVLISGNDILVSHNGTVLSKDNIKEFEATYNTQNVSALRFNKHDNGR